MTASQLSQLATQLLDGEMNVEQFVQRVNQSVSSELEDATVDLDRNRRCGYPEVIFAEGKTANALKGIISSLLAANQSVLATRVSGDQAHEVLAEFPEAQHNRLGRTLRIELTSSVQQPTSGRVAIVTAGTSDRPVAEEARETLRWMNVEVDLVQDVGVAGPHRLPAQLDKLDRAHAIVVVAGMEGALPSVVGGYVACPVIAVPTSVGYGASLGGLAALLGMLNSCAANVTVVNIDAGFKGAYVAGLIAQQQ